MTTRHDTLTIIASNTTTTTSPLFFHGRYPHPILYPFLARNPLLSFHKTYSRLSAFYIPSNSYCCPSPPDFDIGHITSCRLLRPQPQLGCRGSKLHTILSCHNCPNPVPSGRLPRFSIFHPTSVSLSFTPQITVLYLGHATWRPRLSPSLYNSELDGQRDYARIALLTSYDALIPATFFESTGQ